MIVRKIILNSIKLTCKLEKYAWNNPKTAKYSSIFHVCRFKPTKTWYTDTSGQTDFLYDQNQVSTEIWLLFCVFFFVVVVMVDDDVVVVDLRNLPFKFGQNRWEIDEVCCCCCYYCCSCSCCSCCSCCDRGKTKSTPSLTRLRLEFDNKTWSEESQVKSGEGGVRWASDKMLSLTFISKAVPNV